MKKETTKATIQLLLEEPFFGHLLSKLPKSYTSKVENLGVRISDDYHYTLLINPKFWKENQPNHVQKIGAIKHELLHLIFAHPIMCEDFPNKTLLHIAADLVVNQYLPAEQLENDALTISSVFENAVAPHKSLSFYYNHLESIPDKWNELSKNQHLQKHQFWNKSLPSFSKVQTKIIAGQLQQFIKGTLSQIDPQGLSSIPGSLKFYLNHTFNPPSPSLNWQRILRFFVNNSLKTKLHNTLHRPSKRYGTYPGTKIKNQRKILIAIDTSASIDESAFHQFFAEIHQIWKRGSELMIVECDTIIHKKYPYKGQKPSFINGRGGTFFDPPIVFANEVLRVDGIIYFTDGAGPPPKVKNRIPILWAISPNGINSGQWPWEELKGRKVKLKNHA